MTSMETPPPLLRRLALLDGESVVSLIQRHCEANYASRMLDVLKLISRASGADVRDASKVVRNPAALEALEYLTGHKSGRLSSHRLVELQGAHARYLRQGHHEWPEDARWSRHQAVCPVCLRETGYARECWEFTQAPVCLVHQCMLLEHCPACTTELRHNRTALGRCGRCGFPLGTATSAPVHSAAVLRAAAAVQSPVTLAMGDVHSTSPVSVQELSALLRLCTLPGPGQSTDLGFYEALDRIPLDKRVVALDNLGYALSDRRIDSSRLREVVLHRWPYAAPLPRSVHIALLESACSSLQLPRDVRNLLCLGTEFDERPSASVEFGSRLPVLRHREDVARFLGIELATLNSVLRFGILSDRVGDQLGHDMDEVLHLRRTLDAVLSFSQVDEIFGLPGLTKALVEIRLLPSIPCANTEVGVHPHDICTLLGRVYKHVQLEVPPGTVALDEQATHQLDPSQLAWAVAQVVGGSMEAFGGDRFCRLSGLRVAATSLLALSQWHACEVHSQERSTSSKL